MTLHIDYYASLNSPWTHMGAARIEAMAAAHGASLRIYPVDFGEIFANSGGLPLPRRSPQRQAYRLQELARWRDYLGIPIHVQPKHFPASEAISSGCIIALRETMGDQPAIKLAHAVLKAVWQRELNPGERARCGCGVKTRRRAAVGRTARGRHESRPGARGVWRPVLCHRR